MTIIIGDGGGGGAIVKSFGRRLLTVTSVSPLTLIPTEGSGLRIDQMISNTSVGIAGVSMTRSDTGEIISGDFKTSPNTDGGWSVGVTISQIRPFSLPVGVTLTFATETTDVPLIYVYGEEA